MSKQEYILIGGSNNGIKVFVPDDTRIYQMIDRRDREITLRLGQNFDEAGQQRTRIEQYEKMTAIIDGVKMTWLVLKGISLVGAIKNLYYSNEQARR